MKIKEIVLDRYGAWSNLRLSDLDDRLSVVYAASEWGQAALVHFLPAMLYGVPDVPESAAPLPHAAWSGSLTVEGPHGRCVIRRSGYGPGPGRLTLCNADGDRIARRPPPELLAGVEESVFRLLFVVRLGGAPRTEALVQLALARGFDVAEEPGRPPLALAGEEASVHRPAAERWELDRLTDRFRAVEAEIAALESQRSRLLQHREDELRRLREAIDRGEAERLLLGQDLQALDDEIALWEEGLAAPPAALSGGNPKDAPRPTLRRRLEAAQARWERWRRVGRDLLRRRARLRRELMSWTVAAPDRVPPLGEEAQKLLAGVERRLEQLQQEMRAALGASEATAVLDRAAGFPGGSLVEAVREDVYRLCRELHCRTLAQRREEIAQELRQLRRCHQEIAARLRRLMRRKERLARAWEAQNAAIAPVRRRRQETAVQLRRCEAEAARLEAQRRRLEQLPALADEERRLAARRRELEILQREIDRRREPKRVLPERGGTVDDRPGVVPGASEPCASEPCAFEPRAFEARAFEEASEHLRRLTDGQFRRIRIWRGDRRVWVEDAQGRLEALESQRPAVRDLTHVALCLALVRAFLRRGVELPLVVDEAFHRLDSAQAQRLAMLLWEFGQGGPQVLVFTQRESAARLFRRLHAPLLELPVEEAKEARRRAGMETRTHANDFVETPSGPAAPRRYLDCSDALAYAPDLDQAAAAVLAAQGVATVGEFLALTPEAIEQRLAPLGVDAETIRQWRAMARLMCETPGLRAYDARILAASGVRSAQELERLSPEELLRRVQRCLASAQGDRLLRRGDDEELARLANWIGSARATQALRRTQLRHEARRQRRRAQAEAGEPPQARPPAEKVA